MPFCIPGPQTASGAFFGPPDWLDPAGPAVRNNLDDPRWTGAFHQGFPAIGGTSEQASFRAMFNTVGTDKFLYLSWWVKVDGIADTGDGGDNFYVGFRASVGGTAMVIKVIPYNSTSANITNQPSETIGATPGVGSISVFTNTGASGAWVSVSPDPTWINSNTRVWFKQSPVSYAVQMRVPLKPLAASITNNDGPNLADDFRMWYSMRVVLPTMLPTFYSWMDDQDPTGGGLSAEQFPNPNTWESYRLGTGGMGCTAGISLTYDDIGTTNLPENRVRLSPNTNRFFARPTNAGGSIAASTIKATFRIANWGSMIGYINAPWDNITNGVNVTHTAVYPTGQAPIPSSPPSNPNPTPAIWFDWTLTPAESAPYISGAKNSDQCMIVNLTGQGLTFSSDSACKNMSFDNSSLTVRRAFIDIRGLQKISDQPRDVYILVEKVNMPANTPAGYNEGQFLKTTIDRLIAANNSEDPNSLGKRLRVLQDQLSDANSGEISESRLDEMMAELRVLIFSFKSKDESLAKELTERLLASISDWLRAVKQDKPSRKRLAELLEVMQNWLRASVAGGGIGLTLELVTNLTGWLSGINSDQASSTHLPRIGETFQQWLGNLVDEGGSITRLSAVIESLVAWLNSDRSPDRLLAVLDALRKWLGSLGRDENQVRQKLAWFIQGVLAWLSPATDRLVSMTQALHAAGITADEYDQIFPTCRFHAFHDTGRREEKPDGRKLPVLRAQVPFGHWLYHEDDLQGWTAVIEGATRLAENFYVVRVPNNGATEITTKIQAVEEGEERIKEPPIVTPGNGKDGLDPLSGCRAILLKLLGGKG